MSLRSQKSASRRLAIALPISLIILGVIILVALAIGSARLSLGEVLDAFLGRGDSKHSVILFKLRMPRIVLGGLVGICLATAGALLQAVMRNPLADPGTIGVSAGASTVATFILLVAPRWRSSVPLFAFLGASIATVVIFTMAWKDGISPVRIILSGVAVNSVLGGFTALLQMLYAEELSEVLGFLNGNLSSKTWGHAQRLAVYAAIGVTLAVFCIRKANALQLGDEIARNLGENVNFDRILLSAVSAFLAASTVSVIGLVGFVGLVVPHIARMIVGSDYRHTLPMSMSIGASLTIFADTVGRSLKPGMEIPLGIIMTVCGGPFFLYMLRKQETIRGN
ncbi:MAG: iron ABC transporter permease [Eubacteriales bacterium]|nr:iron ABC transporter permease [Eubacteriales bacterium]